MVCCMLNILLLFGCGVFGLFGVDEIVEEYEFV